MIRQKSCYISICCSLDHKVFMLIAILHPDVFLHIGKKKKKRQELSGDKQLCCLITGFPSKWEALG